MMKNKHSEFKRKTTTKSFQNKTKANAFLIAWSAPNSTISTNTGKRTAIGPEGNKSFRFSSDRRYLEMESRVIIPFISDESKWNLIEIPFYRIQTSVNSRCP